MIPQPKKVLEFLWVCCFIRCPSYLKLSESPSRHSILRLYPELRKTKSNASSIHSPYLQRREPLDTCNPRSFEDYVPLNSIAVRKCRGHLQATREFGVFPFISPSLGLGLLCPNSFIDRILPSSCFS